MTLNQQKNSWKQCMGGLWKKWMNCGCKLLVKNPFCHWSSRQNHQSNIAKVQAQNVVFWLLDDIELVDWTTANFLFARLWFCEDIHHSSIFNLAIEKAIQKSTNAILSSKLFQDDSNYEKNQFIGFVSSHKRAHCWHPSIFTACLSSILIFRRTQLRHASWQSKITFCQICRIGYFRLCN